MIQIFCFACLQPHHPLYPVAQAAVTQLPKQGRELHIVPQNLVEVWAAAIRPPSENGLGLNTEQAAADLAYLKGLFNLLADTEAIHSVWERLSFSTGGFGQADS